MSKTPPIPIELSKLSAAIVRGIDAFEKQSNTTISPIGILRNIVLKEVHEALIEHLSSASDVKWDEAYQAALDGGALRKALPTRPQILSLHRELFPGEVTRQDDLVWVGGRGPWSQLQREDTVWGYRYNPQRDLHEVGHFMHLRRIK